ncbi:Ig-like domain-containing protein [Nocardioides sp. NPDC047086]|uniref:Ig-like domain-containing protein n=1 Tax=Nocardioides sp. NPDC047086 TaxID=3154810 RepID=UPI00340C5480
MARFGMAPGWMRRHRTSIASWTALAVVAGGLTVYAIQSTGYPVHKADLDDGGIWVTNQSWGTLGRQNRPVAQLDGVVWAGNEAGSRSERAGLDVVQNGIAVASVDRDARTITPVNTKLAEGIDDDAVTVKDSRVVMGGNTIGVAEQKTGKVWLTSVDPTTGVGDLSDLSGSTKPTETVGADAVLTIGTDGTAYAVSAAKRTLTAFAPDGERFADPAETKLPKAPEYAETPTSATVVGGEVVTLDEAGWLLGAAKGSDVAADFGETAESAVLQQPSAKAKEVLVGDATGLKAVALSNGEIRHVAESAGDPAAPVRLGDCVFGAWANGSTGSVVTQCGEGEPVLGEIPTLGPAAELEFRINRGQLVLNDLRNGDVWEIDGADIKKISNWESFQPQTQKQNQKKDKQQQLTKAAQAPKAKDDHLGARAGRTTVLHVLDNDSSAKDSILSVVSVGKASVDGVEATIAPDRQSILVTTPESAEGKKTSFKYTVDDGLKGKAGQDDASVELSIEGSGGTGKPTLREHYTPTDYTVAAGGTVEIPVVGDWRDERYGDPVTAQSPTASKGKASVTPDGLLRYTAASDASGSENLGYQVSTGGKPSKDKVRVNIVAGATTASPEPKDDVAEGTQGSWVTIRPLDNDIPGADPSNLDATLTLAGDVPPKGGLEVSTDRETGVVRARGSSPGTYQLSYNAGFGAAKPAAAKIRVDVKPASQAADEPIATPDTTAVLGTSTRTLDVLANDYDSRGRLLAVTHAEPVGDSDLTVAVLDGRWLRIQASKPDMDPSTQAIRYTISNGAAEAEGSVTVSQRPALRGAENAPEAVDDEATVRAADSVSIPVLDNDSTPSGDPVGLVVDQTIETKGQLQVLGQPTVGEAYIDGNRVRYVAPDDVKGPVDVDVRYVVQNTGDPSAEHSSGNIRIHVKPLPKKKADNSAPAPKALESRVVQGDEVTLRLPTVGTDPDGDSVSVTRINSAPSYGRVLAHGANTITYQAFPNAAGTDEFTYEVSDPFGAVATGTVRIAVVAPGAPQRPVAVDDLVTLDPAKKLTYDVLANDLRTPGTELHLASTDAAEGSNVKQRSDGIVTVEGGSGEPFQHIPYRATTGLHEDTGELAIRYQEGYDNPPMAGIVVARPEGDSSTTTVDVMTKVTDIDDALDDLAVDAVKGPSVGEDEAKPKIDDGKVTLPVGETTRVWTYRVTDPDGAQAVGSIYVPARPKDAPYLKPGSELQFNPGETKNIDITDYVEDPEGDPVVLTTTDKIVAAPEGMLNTGDTTATTVKVTAGETKGPATLTFEVADREKITSADAHLSVISLPVQIGKEEPEINCPSTPVEVPESGNGALVDIAAICHVWTADPGDADDLDFTAEVGDGLDGVEVKPEDGGLRLTAEHADAGAQGALEIGVEGTDATGQLLVTVIALPAPSLSPIKPLQTEAGKTVAIDIADYLQTPVPSESQEIVITKLDPVDGDSPDMGKASGSKITFNTPEEGHGHYRYAIEVSDSGKDSKRVKATGVIEVDVIDVPGAPTGLRTTSDFLSNVVALSWNAPKDNGDDPIQRYEVEANGDHVQDCPSTSCRITGLKNGVVYDFRVRAVNSVGPSREWSNSAEGEPDAYTGPVQSLRVTRQRDHKVELSWAPPAACDCSDVQKYRISWPGGGIKDISAGQTTYPAAVSSNGDPVQFTVVPLNDKGVKTNKGPSATVEGMGAGKPDTPATPTFEWANTANNSGKAVTVSWSPVAANGPAPVTYEVRRTGGTGEKIVCSWVTETSCRDDVANDGTIYTYAVRARNAEATSPRETGSGGSPEAHISSYSAGGKVEAAATPDAVSFASATPTGANGTAEIVFTPRASHGKTNRVECVRNGSSCGSWTYSPEGAGQQTKTITGFTNGTSTQVQLRACNDSSGGAGAGDSCGAPTSKNVTTYGPLGTPSISASVDGNKVNWRVSYNPNGKAATVTVKRGGTEVSQFGTGTGAGSRSGTDTAPEWNKSYTYTVTISDSPRASKSDSVTVRTDPPPDPTMTVNKAGECSGSACPQPETQCGGTCWYVGSTITDPAFPGTSWDCGTSATTSRWNVNIGGDGKGTGSGRGWVGANTPFTVTCTSNDGRPTQRKNVTW